MSVLDGLNVYWITFTLIYSTTVANINEVLVHIVAKKGSRVS